jgi:outer membrane protein assembly factor BamB
MKRYALFPVAIALLHVSPCGGQCRAENWPQMRGPHGTCAVEAHHLPVEFGPEKNVKWKLELPGHSAATPAVWGDRIFVVSPSAADIYLMCIDTAGKEQWRHLLGTGNHKVGFNGKNNFATPSPATDGRHVWALAGSGDLWCLDMDGKPVWHANLFDKFERYRTLFGIGFSPLLYKGMLYVPYLHQGSSFIAALDAETGNLRWQTPRPTSAENESKDAYSSPCVFEYPDHAEIIICGADLANAYDSQTGKEIWRHGDINPTGNKTLRIIVSPLADRQRIYVASAKGGPVHAIRPGGQGDVTRSHRVWTHQTDTPDVPTPAVHDGLLYLLREVGVMTVLEADSGRTVYHQRVASGAGAFSPSPVVADGKVYLASEGGRVVVLAAGRQFKKLAENELGELIMATPVVVDDCLYIRTEKHLYCFAEPS